MNFILTEEQEAFRDTVHRFVVEKSPLEEVRRLMETEQGFDGSVWRQITAQLGLTALLVPERFGGLGYGYIEAGIAFEELGRSLMCTPLFSTVALGACMLIATGDDEACANILPDVATGDTRLAVAVSEGDGTWIPDHFSTSATVGKDSLVTGTKHYVIDGGTATKLLVVADSPLGTGLYLVDASDPSVTKAPLISLDLTRKLADITFDSTPARLIGHPDGGRGYIGNMLRHALVLLACEQVGGAERVLDMAVRHAKTRVQFGRAIGSFQAIKHKCADMLVEVESAKSAAYYARWALDNSPAEGPLGAFMAKARCSEAYFRVASENIQIHGGIGFTWEHDAHLFFKRAKTSELLFGGSSWYREKVSIVLGI